MSSNVSFSIGLELDSFIAGVKTITGNIRAIGKDIDSLNNRQLKIIKEFDQLKISSSLADKSINSVTKSITTLNSAQLKLGADTYGDTIKSMSGDVVGWEESLSDLRKSTNLSREETLKYGQELGKLSLVIPLPINAINAIAGAGAKLGIVMEDLSGYTLLVSKSSVAFDMQAPKSADAIAKLKNMYDIGLEELETEVLDTIALLDDSGALKAEDLVDYHTRVGSLAKSFGLTLREASALGSTFLNQGINADVAATATQDLILTLNNAENGTKSFKAGLSQLGLTARDLKQAIAPDASGALKDFLKRINQLPQEDQLSVISGMFGTQNAASIVTLTNGIKLFEKELSKATDTQQTAGYLQQQFNTAIDTTAARIQLSTNELDKFRNDAIFHLLTFEDSLVAIVGGRSVINALETLVTLGTVIFVLFKGVLVSLKAAAAAQWLFNAALAAMSVVGVVAVVAAIAAGAYLIIKNWDTVKAYFATFKDWLLELYNSLWDSLLSGITKVFKTMTNIFANVQGWIASIFGEPIVPKTIPGGVKGSLPSIEEKMKSQDMQLSANKPVQQIFNGGINVSVNAPGGKLDKQQAAMDIEAAVALAMKNMQAKQKQQSFAFSG